MKRILLAALLVSCGSAPPEGADDAGTVSVDGGAPKADAGVLRDELSGARLKVRFIEGDDGSKQTQGFFDTARAESCSFLTSDDGNPRCLPVSDSLTIAPLFADSACTQALASSPCAGRKYAYTLSTTCPAMFSLYVLTVLPAPAMVFRLSGTNCVSQGAGQGVIYYVVGEKVAPGVFVKGTAKIEQ